MELQTKDKKPAVYGRTFLIISGLMYWILGVLFLINPAGMASGLGFTGLDNNALTEISASFGGLWTAIGTYIFICYKNKDFETGLKIVFWTFTGFALGRTAASLRFSGFYGLHCYWLAFELAWVMITFNYLKKYRKCEE